MAAKSEAVDQISAEGDALGQAVGAYAANITMSEKALGAAVDAAKAALDAAPATKTHTWELHGDWDSLGGKRVALATAQRQLKRSQAKDERQINRAVEDAKSKLEETSDDLGRLYLGDLSQAVKDAEEAMDEAVESGKSGPSPSTPQEDEDPALLAALQDS